MFTWLVIIFVLAIVFGVVKVETLKDWGNKALKFGQDSLKKVQDKASQSKTPSKDDDTVSKE